MHDKLIIIGASGHGKVLADIAQKMGRWKEIYFLDDNKSIEEVMGFKVLGNAKKAPGYKDEADFIVGIGDNSVRERIQKKLASEGLSLATLVHPNAIIGMDVSIGVGTVIMGGTVINSTTNIGNGCIINTSSSVDHDNIISDYVHISPGVRTGGNVVIGRKVWLGISSTVMNNIIIQEDTIIGAGSTVLINIKEYGRYVGSPARRITKCKKNKKKTGEK